MKQKLLVIHWYIQPRDIMELSPIEKFHLYEYKKYKLNDIFDKVDCCLSIDDTTNIDLLTFCEENIRAVFGNKLTIHIQKNDKEYGEFHTYKKYVIDRLNLENTMIFYCHFKGVSKKPGSNFKLSRFNWSKNMYHHCFSEEMLSNLYNYILLFSLTVNAGWSWFDKNLWKFKSSEYEKFKKLKIKNNRNYPAGSFYWINTDKCREYLENNGYTLNVFNQINYNLLRTTHVCEYLLASILPDNFKFYKYYDNKANRLSLLYCEYDDYEKELLNSKEQNTFTHSSGIKPKSKYVIVGNRLIRKK